MIGTVEEEAEDVVVVEVTAVEEAVVVAMEAAEVGMEVVGVAEVGTAVAVI